MFTVKPYTIKAGAEETIYGVGNYVFVVDSTEALEIKGDGIAGTFKAGQGTAIDGRFESLTVRNTGAADVVAQLAIGLGRFQGSEFSGKVTITGADVTLPAANPNEFDYYRPYTQNMLGNFYMRTLTTSPNASYTTVVQLVNPVGSGKRCVVHAVRAKAGAETRIIIGEGYRDHTDLTGVQPYPFYLGKPQATMQFQYELWSSSTSNKIGYASVEVGKVVDLLDRLPPIVMDEGKRLQVAAADYNVGVEYAFLFEEIPLP